MRLSVVVSAVNWPGILKEFHSETSGFLVK